MKIRIVLLSVIAGLMVLFADTALSQEVTSNLAKYWYYRNRLDYFVVPGEKIGESQVASLRNSLIELMPGGTYSNIDFGQHGTYTGYYWGVLATEYYLLLSYGQNADANKTLNELTMALNAFINYMDKCEYFWNIGNRMETLVQLRVING